MPLAFGLNVKPKSDSTAPPSLDRKAKPVKSTIFDSDPESEEENVKDTSEAITDFAPSNPSPAKHAGLKTAERSTISASKPPPSLKASLKERERDAAQQYQDLASERVAARHAAEAEAVDATIYDYDSFHTTKSSMDAERKAAQRQDAIERKPKYMTNLLESAARRKQDQLVAQEKLLQREREAEGDEFADKEKFVTAAYKKQQEEAREIAAEEERKRAEEEKRRKTGMGGLSGFYKGVMAEQEARHQQAVEAGERAATRAKSGVEDTAADDEQDHVRRAAEEARRAGRDVVINEEGQVADKRQLLTAGLNVAPSGSRSTSGGAAHLRTDKDAAQQAIAARNAGRGARDGRDGQRDRQTRMLEEQLEAGAKRRADDEAEARRAAEHKAKSAKTESEVGDARARFLARKREREEAAREKEKKDG